jgi:PAS fold
MQPVTLLRLTQDGTFLAVNEAGLAVLGAERLEQLLGTSFGALLPADERTAFQGFLERVIAGHRGSIEVDLTALTGTRHITQIHASPHPGAPDAITSVLVSLREVTEARRLEQSLVDAMAQQADQQRLHEAERAQLKSDLERAREGQADSKAHLAELQQLEQRLREAEAHRAETANRLTAEVEGLTEALEERQRISEEQAVRLKQLTGLEAELADASARHSAVETERAALLAELELARHEREQRESELSTRLSQYEADVAALKDALNESMNEQARLAETMSAQEATAEAAVEAARARVAELERSLTELQGTTAQNVSDLEQQLATARQESEQLAASRREADEVYLQRASALESALASTQAAERAAASRLRDVARAAEQVARQVLDLAAAAGAGSGVSAGALAARIQKPLSEVLGQEVTLAVLVPSPDSLIDAPLEVVEQALLAVAVNRGAVMRTGQVAVELAEVTVDDSASSSRGGLPPGPYVLVAMHIAGQGATEALPRELFESADRARWESASAGLPAAHESVRLAGGWIWLAQEGNSGVVFEIYLPRDVTRPSLES